jgi:general secretion pathway protein M
VQARFAALAPREQWLVGIAAVLAVVCLLWFVGMKPALQALAAVPAERERLDTQWQSMQRLAEEAAALRAIPPLPPGQAAAALQSATTRVGTSARLVLQGERAVVTFTAVPPGALRTWLAEVRSAARARPVEVRLARAAAGWSGTVTLELAR